MKCIVAVFLVFRKMSTMLLSDISSLPKRRYLSQESNSIILWDKPKISQKEYFSHDIPPGNPPEIRWNYPIDPPIRRSKQIRLIENHKSVSNSNEKDNEKMKNNQESNENQQFTSQLFSSRGIGIGVGGVGVGGIKNENIQKNQRPQSATITKNSTTIPMTTSLSSSRFNFESQQQQQQQQEISTSKLTNRPFSAPKARISSSQENKSLSTPPITTTTTTTTTGRTINSNHSFEPSGIAYSNKSNNNNNEQNLNLNLETIKQTSSQTPERKSTKTKKETKKLNLSSKVEKKKEKKNYFDFKKLPKDLFQSTDSYLFNHTNNKTISNSEPYKENNKGLINSTSFTSSSSPSIPSSSISSSPSYYNNQGRSEDTARIHYLIDDLMMKLSQVETTKERHALKAEFTKIISKFAQQPSKGGNY